MMPLAEIPVEPLQLFGFIGSAGALLVIYNQAKSAFGHTPPLHKEFATKSEVTEVHGRIKRERAEIDKAIADVRAEYRGLNAKLDGELKDMRQTIDEVPDRTIALLAKTKGLL